MSNSESFFKPPHETPLLRVSAGQIMEEERILFNCLPRIVTFTDETVKHVNLPEFRAFAFLEGEVYRVFLFNGNVHIATSRRVDQITHQQLFEKIGIRADDMENNHMYVFIKSISGCVTFLGVSDGSVFTHANDLTIFPEMMRREELFFDSIEAIDDYVFETDKEVILLNESKAIRIVSTERNDIRGNTKTLKYRYLELRSKNYDDLPTFLKMYPEMVSIVDEIEEQIYSLAKHLHDKYMRIFIKNETTLKCSKDERTVLGLVHKLYTNTKQRTIPSRVNDVLVSIHPSLLDKLLKKHTLPSY